MAQIKQPDPLKDWTLRLRPRGGPAWKNAPVRRLAMLLKRIAGYGFDVVGYDWPPMEGKDDEQRALERSP